MLLHGATPYPVRYIACLHNDVTQILDPIDAGVEQACEALLPLVYDQLRKAAQLQLGTEQPTTGCRSRGLPESRYQPGGTHLGD